MSSVTNLIQDALMKAIDNITPRNGLETAVLALLVETARTPDLIPKVMLWIKKVSNEEKIVDMPDDDRIPSGLLSHLVAEMEKAESESMKGTADLIGTLAIRIIGILLPV